MAELPSAAVVHALPGRVRIRLPALRGDIARMSALALAAAALPRVAAAQASAMTGSLLILYGGTLDDLLGGAATAGLFAVQDAKPQPAGVSATLPEALVPAVGAMAAAGLAALQLLRREALPPALTLGWYAVTLAQSAMQRGFVTAQSVMPSKSTASDG